jgi:hypothetical protein
MVRLANKMISSSLEGGTGEVHRGGHGNRTDGHPGSPAITRTMNVGDVNPFAIHPSTRLPPGTTCLLESVVEDRIDGATTE